MKNIITTLFCLLTIFVNAQTRSQKMATFDKVSSAMRKNYVSESDEMRWSGVAAVVSGVAIIIAHNFEGNESWKHASKGGGWYYDPYLKQSTRPFMIPIGITFTIGGVITILRN